MSFFAGVTGGEVDLAVDDDGGGVAASGDGGFPANICFSIPLGDWGGIFWSVVIALRASPLWPVSCLAGCGGEGKDKGEFLEL